MFEQVGACRGKTKRADLKPKSKQQTILVFYLNGYAAVRPSYLGNGEPERAKMAAKPPFFASLLNGRMENFVRSRNIRRNFEELLNYITGSNQFICTRIKRGKVAMIFVMLLQYRSHGLSQYYLLTLTTSLLHNDFVTIATMILR